MTKDAIIKAWLAREKANPSFSVTWRVNHTYLKGSLLSPTMPKKINPKNVIAPAEDYSFDVDCTLKVEGTKVRYDYQWEAWSTPDSAFRRSAKTDLFDGKTNTQFTDGKDKPSVSGVSQEAYAIPLNKQQTRAIVLALRPSALPLSILNLDKLKLAEQRPFLGDVECVVLDSQSTGWRYWIDPNRDYCIVCATLESKTGVLLQSFDIDWFKEQGYWLPRNWMHSVFGAKEVLQSHTKGFDVRYQLNQPVGFANFAFDYPPNTLIVDQKDQSKPASHSVIASDGTKRAVTRNELVHNSWTELTAPENRTINPLVWVLGGIVVVVICALLVVYRKRLFHSTGEMQ